LESDEEEEEEKKQEQGKAMQESGEEKEGKEEEEEEEEENECGKFRPRLPPSSGTWACNLRAINPATSPPQTVDLLRMGDNETLFSVTTCQFERNGEEFVVVGGARNVRLHPFSCEHPFLRVFRFANNQFHLYHTTFISQVPFSLCGYRGWLAVGGSSHNPYGQYYAQEQTAQTGQQQQQVPLGMQVKKVGVVSLYDLGKSKMLKKCENMGLPSRITSLKVSGVRLFGFDLHESAHLMRYCPTSKTLVICCDDISPRPMSCGALLDHHTVAGGDRLGNLFVMGVKDSEKELVDDVTTNPGGSRLLWDEGVLRGAAHKFEHKCHFYLGDIPTAMEEGCFVQGRGRVVVVSTISGAIWMLIPLISRSQIDFFTHTEIFLRQEHNFLTGRDHLRYRGLFLPVRAVVDGQLINELRVLPGNKKEELAEELDMDIGSILMRLEDTLNEIV
jgi:splicing factor 3B subunit 3